LVFRFAARSAAVFRLLTFELPGEAPDYYETLVSRARTVTAADVQRVAQGYLQPHALTILQLGP